MSWAFLFAACAAVALAAWVATRAVLKLLIRLAVYDIPDQRSSHTQPKPLGGGLALLPVLVAAWIGSTIWFGASPPGFWAALLGALLLAVISWIDDRRSQSVSLRLVLQVAAVGLGLSGLEGQSPVFQGLLPPILDRLAAAVMWLWFINLFNFMDGIDGISGIEAMALGLGLGLVAWLAHCPSPMLALPVLLAAAMFGFLIWNWAPSKLHLGDVGSVPLGYLLGWLLLLAAIKGQWAAALILPLYYLADATITLAKRAARGEKIWEAHCEHYYQRAVQAGSSHAAVSSQVLVCDALLVALAAAATLGYTWTAIAAATVLVAFLLAFFVRRIGRTI